MRRIPKTSVRIRREDVTHGSMKLFWNKLDVCFRRYGCGHPEKSIRSISDASEWRAETHLCERSHSDSSTNVHSLPLYLNPHHSQISYNANHYPLPIRAAIINGLHLSPNTESIFFVRRVFYCGSVYWVIGGRRLLDGERNYRAAGEAACHPSGRVVTK